MATVLMAACSDDSENDNPALPEPDGGGQVEVTTVSGDVSGVWKKNTVVQVDGHLRVPAGSSLTIEEGVQVIFTDSSTMSLLVLLLTLKRKMAGIALKVVEEATKFLSEADGALLIVDSPLM